MSRRGLSPALPGRLPTWRDVAAAFLACLVPIQLWSMVMVLNAVPAWLLQLDGWDLLGAASYNQAFALFEALIVFGSLLLLSLVLPAKWFRDKFVVVSTALVYLSAAWFALAHLNEDTLNAWGLSRQLLPWLALFFGSNAALIVFVHRSTRLQSLIAGFVDRLTVLGVAYLLIAIAALLIVLVRNL